ncbi:MAG: hypothetical protein KO316_00420 [Methanobacterium sp.]|jgi:hypothetical protein|nr:hypothetical protein [Methanobacterium sp.]
MSFLICEKCRGYYELQKGESPEDFESCLCGGKLEYIENIPEKDPDESFNEDLVKKNSDGKTVVMNDKEDKELKSICPNCLKENEDDIFCSQCGGKLLTIKEGKVIRTRQNEDHVALKKISKKIKTTNIKSEPVKGLNSIFERIKVFGVLTGVIFLVIGIFIVFYVLVSVLSWNYSYYGDLSYNEFQFFFHLLIVFILVLGIFSGVLASYISKMGDYVDGLVNGFLVGAISASVVGIYGTFIYMGIVGILLIFIGIPLLGALSSVGGVIGIFLRSKLK